MRKFVLAVGLVLMAGSAQAATLNVVGGQLMGASGVNVGGTLYDVAFADGTCIDLFNGCDDVSDFTFQTLESAILASQALLDQVFLDTISGNFDSTPHTTNGCEPSSVYGHCFGFSPFGPPPVEGGYAPLATVQNAPFPLSCIGGSCNDAVNSAAGGVFADNPSLTDSPAYTFVIWSAPAPIPEPNTALLLSLGLVGLAARRRSLRS